MQVNSLFAIFFAFLALVAPLTSALTITVPSNMTTGNNTISCTDSNATGSLNFFIERNPTQDLIAEGVNPNLGQVQVVIPSNVSGDGWKILAKTFDNQTVGQSSTFSIATTSAIATNNSASGPNMAGAVVGGVIGGIVAVSLVVFLAFLYLRRRRQQSASNPTFNLEAGFTAAQHSRSFSSTMNSDMDRGVGSKSMDLDKIQWERELEEQFARARSGTPDVLRGASPMPRPGSRNTSPPRGVSPMPLVPQRAVSRD